MTVYLLLPAAASGVRLSPLPAPTPAPGAVQLRDVVYVSLDTLGKLIAGVRDAAPQARAVRFTVDGKEWAFINGGHRLRGPDGKTLRLNHPVLVIQGKHYLPVAECAAVLGYRQSKSNPLRLTYRDKTLLLSPTRVDSRFHRYKVEKIRPVHETLVTIRPLWLRRSLHVETDREVVGARTPLLVRRRMLIGGQPYSLVTIPTSLRSYLVPDGYLEKQVRPARREDPRWPAHRSWFEREAAKGDALACGRREALERTVVLTIDFCWSLRAFEEKLLQSLARLAKTRERGIHPVIFLSGRWMGQHPTEMDQLIRMKLSNPRLDFIWGLHSWVHPQQPPFLNSYTLARLRQDTLHLEQTLLEWGIAPSVYYRFPGLVHDTAHLREILALDLFPIDADAWMALASRRNPNDPGATLEFHLPLPGSVALVHGNGNEKRGITMLDDWLAKHPDWELGSPAALFSAGLTPESKCASPQSTH